MMRGRGVSSLSSEVGLYWEGEGIGRMEERAREEVRRRKRMLVIGVMIVVVCL